MAENIAESVTKVSGATDEVKVPGTTDSLPPITKEPIATAEAPMVPSVAAEAITTEVSAAPGPDTTAKPEVPVVAETQEDSTNEPSGSDAQDSLPEKPSDPAPAPEPQPATVETAASGIESSVPANPNDEAVVPPKPVSLEEIRDEDLPGAQPSKLKKSAEEAPQNDAIDAPPATNGDVATGRKRKAAAVEDGAKPDIKKNDTEPLTKKVKANGTTTNGAARKPGRPRKDKTSAPVVGKTARKTRSQGAPDKL